MHTCIHTYIPTYIHTYIHYIHTYTTYIHERKKETNKQRNTEQTKEHLQNPQIGLDKQTDRRSMCGIVSETAHSFQMDWLLICFAFLKNYLRLRCCEYSVCQSVMRREENIRTYIHTYIHRTDPSIDACMHGRFDFEMGWVLTVCIMYAAMYIYTVYTGYFFFAVLTCFTSFLHSLTHWPTVALTRSLTHPTTHWLALLPDYPSRYCIKVISGGHNNWVRRIAVRQDGGMIASCSSDKVSW